MSDCVIQFFQLIRCPWLSSASGHLSALSIGLDVYYSTTDSAYHGIGEISDCGSLTENKILLLKTNEPLMIARAPSQHRVKLHFINSRSKI